jgi:FAD/FMN-containing dehydrogenase
MSKITQYLNEHILGEVTSAESVRKQYSTDGSILNITPEIVSHPRVTNDIRKIARFTWQLAEKGHILPMTVRGCGSDQTGAAIGKGIIVNTVAHLNKILYINLKSKDQFVHVQPGVNLGALNDTLSSHGMMLPTSPMSAPYNTVGGALANNVSSPMSGQYGQIGDWVKRLEVVLANGDLIETTRISRRELDKKKGLQTFEGEIYRKIDGIIDDNQQVINDQIDPNGRDNTGYSGIAKVKQRDGSFDLTPLIVGSQGTLGIISEAVLKTDFSNDEESVVVAVFADDKAARDAASIIAKEKPAVLEVIDGRLFDMAKAQGKKYPFGDSDGNSVGAVLYISYNDFSNGARHRHVKHTLKKLSKLPASVLTSEDHQIEQLYAIREVSSTVILPEAKEESMPPLLDGASIPAERMEEFLASLDEFASKNHVTLPTHIEVLSGVVRTRPVLQLHHVSDKQKTFKLINDYMELVARHGGSYNVESGEGRLKAAASYVQLSTEVQEMFNEIRLTFDPYGTLNPGVKQSSDLKTLVSQLNPDYTMGEFAKYSPLK